MQQKITPNLWFDGIAKEAADFYTSAFPDSQMGDIEYYPNSVEEGLAEFQKDLAGKELVVEFTLGGLKFAGINAGPEFKFNPSVSFMVNFDPSRDEQAREHLDELWEALSKDGKVLMPIDSYPFSKRYGWIEDKYGLTWQLILSGPDGDPRPFIVPCLMFGDGVVNRAEEAIDFYTSLFENSKVGVLARYPEETGPAKAGSLMYSDFNIDGQWLVAMDSGVDQEFTFNEAISLSVSCKDQAEIDRLWEQLSSAPDAEQCGWCRDKYGVSWQIVPENMGELMQKPNAYAHMMQMKKLVIADF